MKYYIQTLGCAMNYSDSERVAALLEKLGYERTKEPRETDLYIFNTCSIRQKGEDRVYGQLKNLDQWKKSNPRLLVGLTGCMVRSTSTRNSEKKVKDEILRRVDSVDFVFRITEANRIGEVLAEAEPLMDLPMEEVETEEDFGGSNGQESPPAAGKKAKQDAANATRGVKRSVPASTPKPVERTSTDYLKIKPKYGSKIQAFVPVQIGCDKYCTYCIVPYARGREESREIDEVVVECRALVENGCKEITLVGQTMNSYGLSAIDKKSGKFEGIEDPFVELLTRINHLHELGLSRVRFIAPHPADYTDALIEAHATLEVMTPHFHLPVQSGSDKVLKKMNRKYDMARYRDLIQKIRARLPEASVTTDIIVGFCTETDEDFEETARAYQEIQWDMAYIARYSPRKGTVSEKAFKDDVSREEKARRWHKLNAILEKTALRYHQGLIGKTLEVLVERFNQETGECEGKSRENKTVQFPGNESLVGQIVHVKATSAMKWLVKGELTKK